MMWSSVDATEVDYAPKWNNQQYIFVPLTLFLIFCTSIIFLNLFIGVVIETFNNQKKLLTNNHLLTKEQRIHLRSELLTYSIYPKVTNIGEGSNFLRKLCINITNSRKFEVFIVVSIMLNTIVLASNYYEISKEG